MAKYRVTIKCITWLGDRFAPNKQRTVVSRNKRLAVHAAYESIVRPLYSTGGLCYTGVGAKVEKV